MVFGKVFDFVKDGVQEMLIQRPDDKKGLIVYKHPEGTIPMYAQLTVDADEAAVFFRDGAIVGTMRTAGVGQRHQLDSQNIPFLGQLIDKVTGGNIFVTDLYFVTMKPIYNQRFGGELGYMEDPLLGEMVTPRIFGTFSFQVTDPARFIVNYVGMGVAPTNEAAMKWIQDTFRSAVKTVVGNVCISEGKSMLQLMPLQSQLKAAMEQSAPDLENIGIRILQVGDFNINLSDDDLETLKQAQSEIGAAKRQARIAQIGISQAQAEAQQRQFELDQEFQQDARYTGMAGGDFGKMAAGKAMIGAGQGMAKGGGEGGGSMMAGAGLGAGFGMAQAFGQAFQQGQPGQQGGAMPGAPGMPGPGPAGGQPQGPSASGGRATCPACNASVPPGKFCAECGNSLTPKPKFCPACGSQNGPGGKFCSNCGTGLPD